MSTLIIIDQLIILGVLVIIGVIGYKTKVITKEINQGIARLVMKITLPLLIFTTFAKIEFNSDLMQDGIVVFLFGFVALFISFWLSVLTINLLKIKKELTTVHQLHTMFGNIVFLGFPLLNALYPGGKGLLYASLFQLSHDSTLWTWGIFQLNKNSNTPKKGHQLSHMLNPNTIAFALGIIAMLIKLPANNAVFNSLSGMGHTTIYLSMLYIGAILCQVDLKDFYKKISVYFLSINKLLIAPIILLLIINGINYILPLSISSIAKTVIVMQGAMPSMIIIAILAHNYGYDEKPATENIFSTTILSLLTLPLVYALILFFN